MSGATFIDLTGAFQIQMGGREVAQISPGAAFQFRQRINLATNPSFEALSGSTMVVRTNVFLNPTTLGQGSTGAWGGTPSAYNTRLFADTPFASAPISLTGRKAVSAPSATSLSDFVMGPAVSAAEGGVYSVGTWVFPTETVRLSAQAQWLNASGGGVGASSSVTVECPANQWTLLKVENATAPVGVTQLRRDLDGPGGQTLTDQFEIYGAAWVVASPVLGDYFDGATSPDPDLTPAWTGTANASISELRGAQIAPMATGLSSSGVSSFSSTHWASSGARSRRVRPTSTTSTDTYTEVARLAPGRTFRVSATCHLESPQTVTQGATSLHGRARGIMLYAYDGGSVVQNPASGSSAPNEAGSHRVAATVTIPPNATDVAPDGQPGGRVRLYNGARLGGGDVWWDDLLIEDVTDQVPADDSFFSGSSPSSEDVLHHWTGPVDASTSAATQAWPPT